MAGVVEVALDVMDRPWERGVADCCTAPCDVFLRLYGVDPMHGLRGLYSDTTTALRLIRARGGFAKLVLMQARKMGLVPCLPREGALGVVYMEGNPHLGICARPGVWIVKTRYGLTCAPEASDVHHIPQ